MPELGGGPLTILFTDVEGSTDLRTQRGDAAAHRILRSHEEVVRRCVEDHDGREIKALGDGFMVAFASARKALACAIAIQQRLEERNADSPSEELRVRIGINTGEVVVEGEDLYGQAVNAAARIAGRAKGGEILVSEIVRQLAGSGPEFTFADRGRCRLKGFPDRWHLYGVVCDATPPVVPGTVSASRTPFVGRDGERTELRRLVAQVKAGTGALVLIGGEPGVGKTRLAEELAIRCVRDGFETFTGHCYEMAGAAPYIPIVEAYEQALARASTPQAFRQFLGDDAPEIARLVPKLRQLCPDIPPPLDLPAEQERRYLFNAVWDVLARTARAQPTLLVLDDIHWADEPTMLLIRHCAERIPEVPVLMVGLYRDSEVDVGRPLSRTFEELTRRRLARWMPLRRLPQQTVAEMLTVMAGQEPPAELVDVIYAETEGNPFFTEEVFKHLAEEGRLFDAAGRFRTDLAMKDLDVPQGVRMVIGARLRRLGEHGPKILGSAAVIGRVFSFEILRQVEDISEDSLLDLIEEAERARLVVSVEGGGDEDRFLFGHELIRQTVLAQLSAPRRRRLHARTAEALERVHASAVEPYAATIAHHLIEAGPAADPERTFHYLLLAGTWALETAAFEEALAHLERAAVAKEFATPRERAELLALMGAAQRSAGRWDEATASWRQAVDAYDGIGDEEAVGRICLQASYGLMWASRMEEAGGMIRRGLEALGDRVSADRARLLAQLGSAMALAERPFDVGEAPLQQALAIAEELGDPGLRGSCLFALCINRFSWGHEQECAEAGLQSAEFLRATGEHWELASDLGFTDIGVVHLGRFEDARTIEAELEPLAERLGNYPALMQARRHRATIDFCRTGDLAALETFARADLEFVRSAGLPWVDHSHTWLGLVRFLSGDWDAARAYFEEAVACEPISCITGWDRSHLFEYLAYIGDRDAAIGLLDAVDDNRMPTPGQPNGAGRWVMLASAVEGLVVLGEVDRAGGLYDLVVECIERTKAVCLNYIDRRLVQRTAGIAAAAAQRWDDGDRHFRAALRQADELPHRPEAAHTQRWYGRMLLERQGRGDHERAEQLLGAAIEGYGRMGMRRHRDLAGALLRDR